MDAERERQLFEKSTKVTEWEGAVWGDGLGYNEGFFASVEDLLDWIGDAEEIEAGERKAPAYVWTCDSQPICALYYDDIIENATQEAYEDWEPSQLEGADKLKAAIDEFNNINKDQVVWVPNMKRALILQPVETTQ